MPPTRALQLGPSVLLSPATDGYVAYEVRTDRLYRLPEEFTGADSGVVTCGER